MMHHNSLLSRYTMDNDIFNASLEIADRNSMLIDGITSHMFSSSLVPPESLDLNSRNQIMAGYPVLSTGHEQTVNDLHITNHGAVVDSDASVSRNMPVGRCGVRDSSISSSHSIADTGLPENFIGGTSLSATSLATLLATSSGLNENLNGVSVSATSPMPLEDFRSFVLNGCCNTSNSTLTASVNCAYDGVHYEMDCLPPKKDGGMSGQLNNKYEFDKFLGPQEVPGKTPVRTVCLPYHFIGNSDPARWILSSKINVGANHPYSYCMPSNELSLSLATCQPSIINVSSMPDQCSEISCSGVTQPSFHEVGLGTGLGSEQTCSNRKELSLGFRSQQPIQFSHILSGSKYLHVVQQILAEIASYSLENLDQLSYSPGGTGAKISYTSSSSAERRGSMMESDELPFSVGETRAEGQMKLTLRRQEVETRKAQLLALLQVVDNRYNQCLDEIHTVISAFHAATELDPQTHSRFALQTISLLYKNLRERITNQLLRTGECINGACNSEKETSFESSFIQKQWALQQLRRKDHQSWRPQRGLPERSVSVLRAWMFQNFLHPYPKDAEKHLLAIRSGLSRSQVSNWFINARVRLWKPMIEEMYSEMNNRKGRRMEEGTDNDQRSQVRNDNQIIQMN